MYQCAPHFRLHSIGMTTTLNAKISLISECLHKIKWINKHLKNEDKWYHRDLLVYFSTFTLLFKLIRYKYEYRSLNTYKSPIKLNLLHFNRNTKKSNPMIFTKLQYLRSALQIRPVVPYIITLYSLNLRYLRPLYTAQFEWVTLNFEALSSRSRAD